MLLYLAGPVRGPRALWRDEFEKALHAAIPIDGTGMASRPQLIFPGANIPENPDDADGRTDLYVAGDLMSVAAADMVVAYLHHAESGRGTGFELGYAHAAGIPLVLIAESPEDRASWCFAIGTAAHIYGSFAEAARLVAYVSAQFNGARYRPDLPG